MYGMLVGLAGLWGTWPEPSIVTSPSHRRSPSARLKASLLIESLSLITS